MTRYQDWQSRMDRWRLAHASDKHVFGTWDCALMAASHVDNITGTSIFSAHAEHYDSADSSQTYLQSLGFADLGALATGMLGSPLAKPSFAQRADIVLFSTDIGPALGIIDLAGMSIIALDPKNPGFTPPGRLPRGLATIAWRV